MISEMIYVHFLECLRPVKATYISSHTTDPDPVPNYSLEWEQWGWPRPVATVACQYLSLDWLQFVCSVLHSWPAHHTLHGILFTPCFDQNKKKGWGGSRREKGATFAESAVTDPWDRNANALTGFSEMLMAQKVCEVCHEFSVWL